MPRISFSLELETFYQLTLALAYDITLKRLDESKFHCGLGESTRDRMDTLIAWASEFDLENYAVNWDNTDFMYRVDDFYEHKIAPFKNS
jgi:hypothetical protein